MGLTTYYTPTRVTFGPGAEDLVAERLKAEGAEKVLVHYGSARIEASGFLAGILSRLDESGIAHVELSGVVPNPRLSLVRKGIEVCRREGVDFILAIGGGSVIDSSKAIGYGAAYEGDVWDFYSRKAVPQKTVPVGCILTMAAAGSEMSDSSVITNDESGEKRGCNSDVCRLRFALMDPTLTCTLPPYQTGCAVVDIMMHTIERYFTGGQSMHFTDQMAYALLRSVMEAGLKALKTPDDYQARATIMWASSLSHNGLMAVGNDTRGDWACHQIEHELSGMFDVAHGAGLAVVFPAWLKYNISDASERIAALGYNVFGVKRTRSEKEDARTTIAAVEKFFRRMGMPTRLTKLLGVRITDQTIDTLADNCTFHGQRTVGLMNPLDGEAIKLIYRLAR